MKKLVSKLSSPYAFLFILILGILLRLFFVFVGGKIYYGQEDYFIQRDTSSWFQAFINLYEHGTFTISPNIDAGKFFRPPGYSFLFGIFYLISLENYALAWKLLVGCQVIMDIASIYLISGIAKSAMANVTNENKIPFSNLCALLYAVYPFVIIWTPVLYAETSSIFFLLLSIYFAFQKTTFRSAFLSGIFVGIATLIRLQCAFGILFIAGVFFFSGKSIQNRIRHGFFFGFAILISYGLWPARNYFLQNRILFSQDLNMGHHWSPDYLSFVDFTHSIGTDHTEYYFQILRDEKVNWPKVAFTEPVDSLLLDSVVNLCRTCSNGFAYWKWGERISPELNLPSNPCDTIIHHIFDELIQKQKSKNSFHYYVTIPLENLSKSFFKMSLYGNKSMAVKLFSSLLFIIRSVLIFTGLFGIYFAFKNNFLQKKFLIFILFYFAAWYLFLSFNYRNMEMRYLVHTDILLLIPAAYVILTLLVNTNRKETGESNSA